MTYPEWKFNQTVWNVLGGVALVVVGLPILLSVAAKVVSQLTANSPGTNDKEPGHG